ncbi:hypothetical protein RA210_U140087 [Rubrivivax sp. A210]|nr:hypothetical protein RA210_U140087 [Rubrivivax sp. A210]
MSAELTRHGLDGSIARCDRTRAFAFGFAGRRLRPLGYVEMYETGARARFTAFYLGPRVASLHGRCVRLPKCARMVLLCQLDWSGRVGTSCANRTCDLRLRRPAL